MGRWTCGLAALLWVACGGDGQSDPPESSTPASVGSASPSGGESAGAPVSIASGTATSMPMAAQMTMRAGAAGASAGHAPSAPSTNTGNERGTTTSPTPSSASSAGAPATMGMMGTTANPQLVAAAWPADCDQPVSIRAHALASPTDTTKFSVPANQEFTATFTFKAPWGENPVQFLASRGHVDERSVVHHWTLFAVDDATLTDGQVDGGPGLPTPTKSTNQMYVVGGTIGSATDLTMPDGIGLRFPSGKNVFFRLEIHYVNPSDNAREDGTGVDFCVTNKPRATEAAAHWLGTYLVDIPAHSKTDVTSTCTPSASASKPVHIMSAAPHMHRTGAAAKLVINRKSGAPQTLFDHPYDYNDQRSYKMPEDGSASDVILNPGDTLTTTCTYQNDSDNAISWGEYSYDEMCFMLVWAWPVGQMMNGSVFGGLVGALPDVTCLEP